MEGRFVDPGSASPLAEQTSEFVEDPGSSSPLVSDQSAFSDPGSSSPEVIATGAIASDTAGVTSSKPVATIGLGSVLS
jgi:hypothetical protein